MNKKFVQWETGLGEIFLGTFDGETIRRADGCRCNPPKNSIKEVDPALLQEFCKTGKWIFKD